MSSDIPDRQDTVIPMDFARRFFTANGAALEETQDTVTVLMPPDLSSALSVPELIQITDSREQVDCIDGPPAYPVMLHAPILDKMASISARQVPFLKMDLSFDYIKTQGFDQLIREQFEFYKTKIKVSRTGETKTRYLMLTCRFKAQSDEIKEGLVTICINRETGAVIKGMSDSLVRARKQYPAIPDRGCSQAEIKGFQELVNRHGPDLIEEEIAPFVKSMNRRFRRDAASLDEYYSALKSEMENSLLRSGLSDELIRDRKEKIAMIPDELDAKKKDLLKKYSILLNFSLVGAVSITSPSVTVFAKLMSGNESRMVTMTYNPATRQMDPVVCASCKESTFVVGCRFDLHLNCPACLEKDSAAC